MEIRRYRGREDARGVARVNAVAWREAYGGIVPAALLADLDPSPTGDALDRWHSALAANERGVFLAIDDTGGHVPGEGGVIGFADVRWGEAGTKPFVGENGAGLKSIYVDPERQGEGVGSALLDRGVEALPDRIDVLRLEVLAANDGARGFYEAHGFERTGDATHDIDGQSYPTAVYSRAV